jgi:cystathionine gamma-synthase
MKTCLSAFVGKRNVAFGACLQPPMAAASFSSNVPMTPHEAGRRAEAMARTHPTIQHGMGSVLAHAGVVVDKDNAAMSPALHMATTYARPADGPYRDGDSKYTRMDNPTRLLLEREMARLETHGKSVESTTTIDNAGLDNSVVTCCAFASGMMAASSIVLAHTAPLHVIFPVDLYHGVPTVLTDVFSRFGVVVKRVDLTNLKALESALSCLPEESDAIVWIETPSNPLCHVLDIEATCDLVRRVRSNTTTVVDSTLAPPTLTQPLLLGADFVLHSATKYLGGHSDVLLGVVTASPWTQRGRELGPLLREVQVAVGGVASAMDSWLTMRGLRTLSVRVLKQCDTAMKLANYLNQHPSVHAVHYPGLKQESAPGHHATAERQMRGGYGGVLSVEMESESKAMALAGALRTIQRATSLGGTETLIEHRASIEPLGRVTSPVGLLRIAVGLEDPDDLINDLNAALEISDTLHSA